MSSSDKRDTMLEFDSPSNSKGYALSGKIMLSAIVVLFFVVILIICLHLYARWYLLRARRRHNTRRSRHRRTTQLVFYVDPSNPHAAATANVSSRGLDEKVLKSLPLFVYSAETHPDPIECAVCLSEFEENDTGRVLPNCKHSFHIECIDMWFHSHSTCPLCRSPVDAPLPKNAAAETGPSSVELASSSAELCTTCQHEEEVGGGGGGGGGGAASTSSFGRSRKPVELMGVTVEVPPRRMNSNFEDESAPESPSLQAFRSPMSRMLSFKRILSRERRAPVSPAASCAESVPELDVERGREETQ